LYASGVNRSSPNITLFASGDNTLPFEDCMLPASITYHRLLKLFACSSNSSPGWYASGIDRSSTYCHVVCFRRQHPAFTWIKNMLPASIDH